MGTSWDEVEEAAADRRSWRNRVAQCVFDADEPGTRKGFHFDRVPAFGVKKLWGYTGPSKKFHGICSLLVQCTNVTDEQTDGRTAAGSKDRAYA